MLKIRIKPLLLFCLILLVSCLTTPENNQEEEIISEVLDSTIVKMGITEVTFKMALDSLINLQYEYSVEEYRTIAIDSASMVGRVNLGIGDEMELDSVPIQDVLNVEYAFLKGKKNIGKSNLGKLYPKVTIEEWTFLNSESPKAVIQYIEKYKNIALGKIYVLGYGPFSYFQIKNKLYLINTAEYMHKENEVLKTALIKYL